MNLTNLTLQSKAAYWGGDGDVHPSRCPPSQKIETTSLNPAKNYREGATSLYTSFYLGHIYREGATSSPFIQGTTIERGHLIFRIILGTTIERGQLLVLLFRAQIQRGGNFYFLLFRAQQWKEGTLYFVLFWAQLQRGGNFYFLLFGAQLEGATFISFYLSFNIG